MGIELLGYSERGVINAICEDIHHSTNPRLKLVDFLSWFKFSDDSPNLTVDNIKNATILLEQSFSDFGDLDLLALIECHSGQDHCFLIEAKVSNDTNSWLTIEDRWLKFKNQLTGIIESTSNLFIQLHRKVRLVARLREGNSFKSDCLIPRGSIGLNQVVNRARTKLETHLSRNGKTWFGAILPDEQSNLDSFARALQQPKVLGDDLPTWCAKQWGFLSWHVVAKKANENDWPRTKTTLDWNEGQIYRERRPTRHAIEELAFASLNGDPVYVVGRGAQHCRVIRLDEPDCGYFWKSKKVSAADLDLRDCTTTTCELPSLPKTGASYVWDSRGELPALPNQGPIGGLLEDGSVVTVDLPSWLTTRVWLPKSASSDTFLVYTHQLRRNESSLCGERFRTQTNPEG